MVDGTLTVYARANKAQNGKMSIMHGKWPSEVSMSTVM